MEIAKGFEVGIVRDQEVSIPFQSAGNNDIIVRIGCYYTFNGYLRYIHPLCQAIEQCDESLDVLKIDPARD